MIVFQVLHNCGDRWVLVNSRRLELGPLFVLVRCAAVADTDKQQVGVVRLSCSAWAVASCNTVLKAVCTKQQHLQHSKRVRTEPTLRCIVCFACRAWAGLSHHAVVHAVCVKKQHLQFPPEAPEALVDLGKACMSHDPEERPTFKDILDILMPLRDFVQASMAED